MLRQLATHCEAWHTLPPSQAVPSAAGVNTHGVTVGLSAGAITVNNVTHSGGTIDPGSAFVHTVGGSWNATGGDITIFGTSGFNFNSPTTRTLSATGAGYKFNVLKSSGTGSIRTTCACRGAFPRESSCPAAGKL